MAAGEVVLTSEVDGRMSDADRQPVWEKVITGTWDTGETGDLTQTVSLNGILQKIIVASGLNDNNVTGQLLVKDNGDNTIFDSGELAESATPYKYNVSEPLSGKVDIVIGASGDPGASGVIIKVTLRGV